MLERVKIERDHLLEEVNTYTTKKEKLEKKLLEKKVVVKAMT